jgi:RNA polymerase sigma-70 factor (ECF subfamily)
MTPVQPPQPAAAPIAFTKIALTIKAKARFPVMAGGAAELGDSGRTQRFKLLALPHLDDVYTLARYLTRNASDADDAVQDCYLRAFRHFDTFQGDSIKPWLFAILRNACHAARAGNARLVLSEDGTADPQGQPMWRDDAETPEQAMLRKHDSTVLRRLIADLPTEFREVIVLRDLNDLSYRDIATVIEAPIGTVMSRLARGRKMLREAWIAAEPGGEAS